MCGGGNPPVQRWYGDAEIAGHIASGNTAGEQLLCGFDLAVGHLPFAATFATELASHFETGGARDHSAARRDLANAKLTYADGRGTTVTLIVNSVDLPLAQDPLGLTRAQFTQAPKSVDASALQFNTRKTFEQTQAGVIVEQELSVVPQQPGVLSLNATIVVDLDGGSLARSYSIPLIASDNPSPPHSP